MTTTLVTPAPGDIVLLRDYDLGLNRGVEPEVRSFIDSSYFGVEWDDLGRGTAHCMVVTGYRTPFRGDGSSRYNTDGHVSVSGGPCLFIPIAELVHAGTTEATFWRWKDMPRGDGGENYVLTVNLFTHTKEHA